MSAFPLSPLPESWQTRVRWEAPLAEYTTFRLGGPARAVIEVTTPDELVALVSALPSTLPWRLIGQGSNLLIGDDGLDEWIIVYRSPTLLWRREGDELIVAAGCALHDLALLSAHLGLDGLTFAAGIPGTLGGALFGNAGAFGEQVGDRLRSATLLTRSGRIREATPDDLGFGYRHSVLKTSGDLVVEARWALTPGDPTTLIAQTEEHLAYRRARHPDYRVLPTAGSFFRNLEATSKAERRQAAGALLEEVGARGSREGDAGVYEKHANIFVNYGQARTKDVIALATHWRRQVRERFGVDLRREVQIWPPSLAPELPE